MERWDENTTFDINLSVGGRWTIIRTEGETTYKATGEYLKIERPHRLKCTYAMPQFSQNSDTISIEITLEEAGCVVTVQAGEDIASELRELPLGSTSASEAGWQQGFDLMAAAWERPPNNSFKPMPLRRGLIQALDAWLMAKSMNSQRLYYRLHPPTETPEEELCNCVGDRRLGG
jgi:uncharacterized protein YndB with AHSA1/START domain